VITLEFVHLHVHDKYSLNDGMCKPEILMKKVKELGMKAIAITNHGNLFGAVEFFKAAKKENIKAIIGCEVYVCPSGRKDRVRDNRHLVLLAKNEIGYKNLIKIVSNAALEGFYYNPRTDYETLKQYSEGLICLTACLGGDVATTIAEQGVEAGKQALMRYVHIFGTENVYLEIQDNGMADQYRMNEILIQLSLDTGVQLVATNDVHYVEQKDAFHHDLLMALQAKTTIYNKANRKHYETDAFYLKSPEEMYASGLPREALANTAKIAEKCSFEFKFGQYHIPRFNVPAPFRDDREYIKHLAIEGLKKKLPNFEDNRGVLLERLNFELGVINDMGFPSYFLVVWDFVKYAQSIGALDGPGRGSVGGALLAYALDITDVNPLKHSLLFERFLNPSRISMPDIDWDIQDDMRHLIVSYVNKKYGEDCVCQIITFNTYGAKAAIRGAGRALGLEYEFADKVAKAIPDILKITLEEAIEISHDLKGMYESGADAKALIDAARAIEGLPSHSGTHAAGVVISPLPVSDMIPLWLSDGVVVSQYDMFGLEDIGMLKMDFLGLSTLTVISNTCKAIYKNKGIRITSEDLLKMVDDPTSYELLGRGLTQGIFQVEGEGMTAVAREMKPRDVEETTALLSLYRPGPMQYIPKYIANKRNPSQVKVKFAALEPILAETYGILCYQEQVMAAARALAGYSLAEADSLRKAIGKKIKSLIEDHGQYFIYGKKKDNGEVIIPGALAYGYHEDDLRDFYEDVKEFGKYAFNKSHGTGYAYITAQTGWLKYHFPSEFMAALLTSSSDNLDKVSFYVKHCERDLKILVLPPDINESEAGFVALPNGSVRFGLIAAKGVGQKVTDEIISERARGGRFKSLAEFIQRSILLENAPSSSTIESLIKCGAFDFTGKSRSQLSAIMIEELAEAKKNRPTDQLTIFPRHYRGYDIVPPIKEFPNKILLTAEKSVLGLYVSGHPMESIQGYAERNSNVKSSHFVSSDAEDDSGHFLYDGKETMIVCLISSVKEIVTKKDKKQMAFLTVEDVYGPMEAIVFSSLYLQKKDILKEDAIIRITGKISTRDGNPKIIAESIELVTLETTPNVYIFVDSYEEVLDVFEALHKNSGDIAVHLIKGNWKILFSGKYWTNNQGLRKLREKGIKYTLEGDVIDDH